MQQATVKHKVSFGRAETQQDDISSIKVAVSQALMESGLPGALSIDLTQLGIKGLGGQLNLKPTISKKDGRVMYNMTGQDVTIGGVSVKTMGNWMLPKDGFCVDEETHRTYSAAVAARDAKRKTRVSGEPTDEELDAGETT